jgi:hypothetical protein
MEKDLQVTVDVIDYFLKVDHFMDSCLKFIHMLEAVMAPYKEVYKYIHKEAKLLKTASFFNTSSVSPHRMHALVRSP